MTEDAAAQRRKEPSAEQSDEGPHDTQEQDPGAEESPSGVEPEGVVSDTTAIKEAGSIGRPATTMRA